MRVESIRTGHQEIMNTEAVVSTEDRDHGTGVSPAQVMTADISLIAKVSMTIVGTTEATGAEVLDQAGLKGADEVIDLFST